MNRRNVGGMGLLLALIATMLFAHNASGGTRTVSWTGVTTYTDNTTIEASNLPVTYEIWYIDSVSGARTTLTTNTTSTSVTFSDSGMVKGRLYNFSGKARTLDGSASADSSAYGWTVPFQGTQAPTALSLTGTSLRWTAPTLFANGDALASADTARIVYNVLYGTSATGPWTAGVTTAAGVTSATVSLPARGVTRWYTVNAVIDGITSPNATSISYTTPFPAPNPPSGLRVQ